MSKIITQKEFIELPSVPQLTDLKTVRVYYMLAPGPMIDANNNALPGVPFVDIPYTQGQLEVEIDLPAMVPVTEGTYMLGTSGLDAAGNESDVDAITAPLDFTPPPTPKWKR